MGLVYLHHFDNDLDLLAGWEIELLVDRVANALDQAAQQLRQRRKSHERAAISLLVRRFLRQRHPPSLRDVRIGGSAGR